MSTLNEGEQTLLEIHPAMFRSNPLGFVGCVLLIAAVGVGLLILGWWWLNTRAAERHSGCAHAPGSANAVCDDDPALNAIALAKFATQLRS